MQDANLRITRRCIAAIRDLHDSKPEELTIALLAGMEHTQHRLAVCHEGIRDSLWSILHLIAGNCTGHKDREAVRIKLLAVLVGDSDPMATGNFWCNFTSWEPPLQLGSAPPLPAGLKVASWNFNGIS